MKQSLWMNRGRRLCAVIGAVWLAGLIAHLCGYPVAALWLFGAGAVLGVALLAILAAIYVSDRRAENRKQR